MHETTLLLHCTQRTISMTWITPLMASLSTWTTLPTLPVPLVMARWPTWAGLVVRTICSPPPVTTGKLPAGNVPDNSLPLLRWRRTNDLERNWIGQCIPIGTYLGYPATIYLRRMGSDKIACSFNGGIPSKAALVGANIVYGPGSVRRLTRPDQRHCHNSFVPLLNM